jgi:hypothetical protein
MLRYGWIVGIALIGASAPALAYPDACQALLPRSLSDALARAYPGYRSPLATDNAPEDIAYNRAHGGTGCLGVGTGDFDGEGKKDFVVGLTARKGSAGLVVIALPRKGGWHFQRIQSGSEAARFRQYVDVANPGRFDRTLAATRPLEPGERSSLDCPNQAVMAGTVEAGAIAYCYKDGRWLHVVVSD